MCAVHGSHDIYIQYDVDNRWNSTYPMLQDGLSAKEQIRHYLNAIGSLISVYIIRLAGQIE
ncbi:hypothetical protein V1508DRAFT_427586 [Lipomyces doorenjongii]|uniref:uncharacterized protein n=1 Tax=Lipomyces doorenjongii TaxID=383834 RepID=UPI0034CE4775